MLDAFVEFEVERRVHVVCGDLRLRRGTFAERHEQMRMLVVGEHDRHGPLDM